MRTCRIAMLLAAGIFLAGFANFAQDDGGANGGAGRKVRPDRGQNQDKIEAAKEKRAEAVKAAAEKRETVREEAKEKREAAREQAKEKRDAAIKKREEMKSERQEAAEGKRENRVDKRQSNQDKRIQHGISKGYLTDDEVSKLSAQQQKISDLEASYKSDGKLTRDECKTLKEELNTASANIWAEKHDTDGNQMAAYRFGKNVFAKDSLTDQLSGEISGKEARQITSDFRQMMTLKKKLNGDLSDDERAKLQSEYDDLLNTYFEVR